MKVNYETKLTITPRSNMELNSLMSFFDSKSEEECIKEVSMILSRILGGIEDECMIMAGTSKYNYDCFFKHNMSLSLNLSYYHGRTIIELSNDYEIRTFQYDKHNKKRDIVLLNEVKQNKDASISYRREYSDYGAKFILTNGDYTLELNTFTSSNENRDELIINMHEEELENYLFSLKMPINIFIVHTNICKILDIDISKLSNYSLKYTDSKKRDKDGKCIEDTVSYSHGNISLIRRDDAGKTLTILNDGFSQKDRNSNNEITCNNNGIEVKSFYRSAADMNNNDSFMYRNLSYSVETLKKRLENPAIDRKKKQRQKKKTLENN